MSWFGYIAMLSFQLIGWVLILLFFGAMIGGHKGVADREPGLIRQPYR